LYNSNAKVQIYIENSTKGRDLTSLSIEEKEVLYERGSSFITLNKYEKDGKIIIIIKEGKKK
jgi:hypothetical protein